MRLTRWGLDKLPIPAHALKTRRVNKACWWVALCIRCAVQLRAASVHEDDWPGGVGVATTTPVQHLMQANCKGQSRREIGDMWPPIWPQGRGRECSTAGSTLAWTLVAAQHWAPTSTPSASGAHPSASRVCAHLRNLSGLKRSVAARAGPMTWASCSVT